MRKLLTCFIAMLAVAPNCFAASVSRVVPGVTDDASSNARTDMRDGRAVSARTATDEAVNTSRSVTPSRVIQTPASRAVRSASDTSRAALDAAVNTVGRNSRVSAASINSDPAVRRAGLVLRPSTAEVGGRATIGDSGVQTGSNIGVGLRGVQSRAATNVTAESIANVTEKMQQLAVLNQSCQEQYNDCMDQFCKALDDNQGRCSCSANLSRYTKTETAVKDANNRLNEVAQNIRYIGLSADEIRTIMTETEAESALAGTADTSETRNMLDKIEDLIRDPTSSNSYVADNFTDFTLDLDFSSPDGDGLFDFDFLNMGNSSSFSNLRGTDLYKAAKKRCNSILTQCKQAGATSDLISGNYDLAIDRDCMAYEQGLKKMNDSLTSNVRSATRMLQKARLTVLQNKNQYDAKGCVAALETCMTDDMVCGEDYLKCVDPTKRYIDENGKVILGQNITTIRNFMTKYNNALIDKDYLDFAYDTQLVDDTECVKGPNVDTGFGGNDGSCIAKYLLQKIGTKQNVTDEGLCRAVLDKCQNYTYDKNDNYKRFNDVVVNYVQRAMVNINAAQRQIISDYASSCITDIASCYNQQVSQVNTWSSNASVANIQRVMSGACRNVALTCAYAVFDGDTTNCPTGTSGQTTCIQKISEMFYQSLLCPDNSVYQTRASSTFGNGTSYVNAHCVCASGYKAQGSACVANGTAGSGGSTSSNTSISCGTSTIKVYDAQQEQYTCANNVTYNKSVFAIIENIENLTTKTTVDYDETYYYVIPTGCNDSSCKADLQSACNELCGSYDETKNGCKVTAVCNK